MRNCFRKAAFISLSIPAPDLKKEAVPDRTASMQTFCAFFTLSFVHFFLKLPFRFADRTTVAGKSRKRRKLGRTVMIAHVRARRRGMMREIDYFFIFFIHDCNSLKSVLALSGEAFALILKMCRLNPAFFSDNQKINSCGGKKAAGHYNNIYPYPPVIRAGKFKDH